MRKRFTASFPSEREMSRTVTKGVKTAPNGQDKMGDYRIYPNPTHRSFSILGVQERSLVSVQLYSLTGQLLEEWNASSNYSNLPLPTNLVNGIYWIKLIDNEGTTTYQKLVVTQ